MPAMTMQTCASENLYLAAYCLTHGARLKRITLSRTNGSRTTAVFELEGEWVQRQSDEYYAGTAVVNLGEYRRHLEGLKDELFAVLKRRETRRREHEEESERTSSKRSSVPLISWPSSAHRVWSSSGRARATRGAAPSMTTRIHPSTSIRR